MSELARKMELAAEAFDRYGRSGYAADCRAAALALSERTGMKAYDRNTVIEEVATSIESAPLTYAGPDPHVATDLRYLIVAAIRDLKDAEPSSDDKPRSESGESFIGENDYREVLLHFTSLRTDARGFVHDFSLACGRADMLLDGKKPSRSTNEQAGMSDVQLDAIRDGVLQRGDWTPFYVEKIKEAFEQAKAGTRSSTSQPDPAGWRWKLKSIEHDQAWVYGQAKPDNLNKRMEWVVEPLYTIPRSATSFVPYGYCWFNRHMEERFTRLLPHPESREQPLGKVTQVFKRECVCWPALIEKKGRCEGCPNEPDRSGRE